MKKRFVSCLLALAMLTGSVIAAADETNTAQTETQQSVMTISTEDVVADLDAKTVSVPITITNNVGIGAVELYISFDAEAFSIDKASIVAGDIFASADYELNVTGNVCTVAAIALSTMENTNKNGTLATLNFTIKDGASSGKYSLVLSGNELVGDVMGNDFTDATEFVNGSITVTRTVEPTVPGVDEPDVDTPDVSVPDTDEPDTDEPVTEEPVEPIFADTAGHWGVSYINKSVEYGLFKGSEDGKFNPDGAITRAQFVTVLWRMAGSPEAEVTHSFTDTDNLIEDFKTAIAWGYAEGFINGISDTEFDPNGSLTREAGMKMLHFYSGGASGTEVMLYAIYDKLLTDSSEISSWAKKSVYWGIYNTLISGTSDTTISPKATMTRAQMAKIMVSYLESEHIQK